MGVHFSQTDNFIKTDIETLCFSLDVLENDITKMFHKTVLIIEETFELKLDQLHNNKRIKNNTLYTHFRINNILFEIKFAKLEKIYSLGYIQINLKMLVDKNDTYNKNKFNELCENRLKELFVEI